MGENAVVGRHLRDLSHTKVLTAVGLGSSTIRRSVALDRGILRTTSEIVDHLSIELLNGLGLTTAGVAAPAALGTTSLALGSFVGISICVGVVLLVSTPASLASSCGLGLRFLTVEELGRCFFI